MKKTPDSSRIVNRARQPARRAKATTTLMRGDDQASAIPAQPRAARLNKERAIQAHAERLFALYGFEGASLESIAQAAGITRHSLLYYYASKEELYRKVLDDVLDQWLASMGAISASDSPEEALSAYIAAKFRFSRDQPHGSQVFTREVIAGAPRYKDAIEARVTPVLRDDLKTLEKWARQGRIRRVDFTHLMFLIWSATQAYADLAPQFSLFLGKSRLDQKDFDAATSVLTHLVLSGLRR